MKGITFAEGRRVVGSARTPAPQTMGQAFTGLAEVGKIERRLAGKLRKAVGFRNIIVRNYEVVDWNIVFALYLERFIDFHQFASHLVDRRQW